MLVSRSKRPAIPNLKGDWPQHICHLNLSHPPSILKKSKTPQGIEPCPDSQECHHRSLLLFCCCCIKGKKQNLEEQNKVCSSRKRKPLHTGLLYYCHHKGISLGHEAETRRKRQLVSPIPSIPHNDTELAWLIPRYSFIHVNKAMIPESLVILKAAFPSAGLAGQTICEGFLATFNAVMERRWTI